MKLDHIAWTGVKFEHDGYTILLRYRQFDSDFPKKKYPERLNIFWINQQTSESGIPTEDELNAQQLFEDRLVEAVESDFHSVMSMILLGKNQKEFVFHTSSPNEFIQRLSDMPQEEDPYPIEINHNADPEWDYPSSVINDITNK
ncbi:MAG: DUF695 domain-containing protein [Bacilli bacterium]|nr:DUF695 domain-containing protein [Bacilli bacterium]